MSRTADYEAAIPLIQRDAKEQLEREIAALIIQRKNLGRFLEIDKEEKTLERIRAESKKIMAEAELFAKNQIDDAIDKAASIKHEAEEYKGQMEAAAETILRDANINLMQAQSALQEIKKAEELLKIGKSALKMKEGIFENQKEEIKKTIAPAIRIFESL